MNHPPENSSCHPEALTLYHYGELDRSGHHRMEEHLRSCSACRRELERLRSVLAMLPKEGPEFSPEEIRDFNRRVTERLRPTPRWPLRPALAWPLVAAAMVLLLVILHSPLPESPRVVQGTAPRLGAEVDMLPDPELLLNLELIENLDWLQELEGTGTEG